MRRLLILSTLLISACAGQDNLTSPSSSVATGLKMNQLPDTLVPGQTQTRAANLVSSSGAYVSGPFATWTSSDPSVASITPWGALAALNPGQTTLTTTSQGFSVQTQLVVLKDSLISLTLAAPASLIDGGGFTLRPVLTGRTGQAYAAPVTYTSSDPSIASIGSDGFVVALRPGSVTLTTSALDKLATVSLEVKATPLPIRLVLVGSLSPELKDTLYAAATRWSGVFNKPLASAGHFWSGAVPCAENLSGGAYQPTTDLTIIIRVMAIDGPNGNVANSGVCLARPDGPTALARITIDSEDLSRLPVSFLRIMFRHEMGHSLGIGAITTVQFSSGVPGENPQFMGSEAIRQYNILTNHSNAGVPLENKIASSIYTHWRVPELVGEVMSPDGGNGTISTVSLGALIDFGYPVDLSKADPYKLP